jgi:hypothetical protein
MKTTLEEHSSAIVVVGEFNPAIFQPYWFSANELIKQSEADASEVAIVSPAATVFAAEWLEIKVFKDRFQAGSRQANMFPVLRDLVVDTFSLFGKIPVGALGINNSFLVSFSSEEEWNNFGHMMVPKTKWNEILEEPGMLEVALLGKRPDDYVGQIRIIVKPKLTKGGKPAVLFNVNDHYEISTPENQGSESDGVVEIISSNWKKSQENSIRYAMHMLQFEYMGLSE